MSPPGCQKMSATPCNRNAEESFPVLSLKSREQEPPNPLLIRDKAFYSLGVTRRGEDRHAAVAEHVLVAFERGHRMLGVEPRCIVGAGPVILGLLHEQHRLGEQLD